MRESKIKAVVNGALAITIYLPLLITMGTVGAAYNMITTRKDR